MTRTPTLPTQTRTTSAAGVLVVRDDRLLLVRQRRASGMRWEVPSGGQEPAEPLEAVAARETKEETGLVVNVGAVACTYVCYRVHQASIVMGAIYRADELDVDAVPVPQLDDGIVAAEFIDPFRIDRDELGQLTAMIVDRWWPLRHDPTAPPFHVELWRTADGYLELTR